MQFDCMASLLQRNSYQHPMVLIRRRPGRFTAAGYEGVSDFVTFIPAVDCMLQVHCCCCCCCSSDLPVYPMQIDSVQSGHLHSALACLRIVTNN